MYVYVFSYRDMNKNLQDERDEYLSKQKVGSSKMVIYLCNMNNGTVNLFIIKFGLFSIDHLSIMS